VKAALRRMTRSVSARGDSGGPRICLSADDEILHQKKREGVETRHLLYVDTAFRYCAVVETFVGDDLTERLNLAYAERVHQDEEGRFYLDKVNRALYPIESLAQLYRMAHSGMFSLAVAEAIWDNRHAAFYLIRDLWDPTA
jgi:hypothetical protein